MKKTVLAVLTAGVIAMSSQAFAITGGVIVHDAQQSMKTGLQWVKEAKQWANELKAYQDELLSKTGIRDVQGLIQDAQSISSDLTEIYSEGESFYSDYIQNPEGVLSPKAKAILDKYQVGKTCANKGFSGDALKGCEAKFLSDLATVEYGNNLESKLKKDNREMKGLIDQVRNAKDPKATADAANAVQLANLKFEKMKFQYEMYRDKQKDMAAFNAEQNKANFEKQQLEAKPTDYSSGWNEYYNEHQSD
ncbi:pilus assembly protein [Escherichia coli]|nr:pilus assembly protein [Escherichia coli]MGE31044.1 pilus assembly protein [Escherichia coli]HDL8517158.1 pilus assembly protein [Yersinia enterocolitica]HDL8557856.1 pilus assembly protein [Yersinia enterocolitica]